MKNRSAILTEGVWQYGTNCSSLFRPDTAGGLRSMGEDVSRHHCPDVVFLTP